VSVLLVVVGLGLLAFVHELGHAACARLLRLHVTVFGVGLGPALLRRKWGKVEVRFAPIPFGGFVRVAELDRSEQGSDALAPRPVASRIAVTLAGPVTNLAFAAVLVGSSALAHGVPTGRIEGLEVTATSAAADEAGLRVGDVITHVEGRAVRTVADLSEGLAGAGDRARLDVRRGGEELHLEARPVRRGGRVGLGARYTARPELAPSTVGEALVVGLRYPFEQGGRLLDNAAGMLRGPQSGVRPVSPVGLADRVSRSGRWDLRRAIAFAALLSVVVGLFNLLPVPGLDGGRICLEFVEVATRRRLPRRIALGLQLGGLLLLAALWLIVTFADVLRLSGP